MTRAVIRLESFFADRQPDYRAEAEAAAANRAYQAGLAAGRAAQVSDDTASMIVAMRGLAAALADGEASRAALRRQAVQALAPVLTAILDALAPAAASARLERSLLAELERLAQAAPPLSCHITCAPEMRPLIEDCAATAGLTAITFDDAPADRPIHLSLQGGHIEFSQEAVAQSIRALIREIQED